jgi:Family of unknown function (DUF6804)
LLPDYLVYAAVERHPYSFYTLLRWICCPVFAYSAFAAHEKNRVLWVRVFGVLAALYNPIFRVHLDQSTWIGVNWFTVGAIIVAAMQTNLPLGSMNKNRKILTGVALAVFGAVIVLHYGTAIHYEGPYRDLSHMSADSIEYAISQGNKLIWKDTRPDPNYPNPDFRKVMFEYPGRGLYLSHGIEDIRIPLFVLAVFYAGLFFILGPSATPKNRPP